MRTLRLGLNSSGLLNDLSGCCPMSGVACNAGRKTGLLGENPHGSALSDTTARDAFDFVTLLTPSIVGDINANRRLATADAIQPIFNRQH